MSIARHPRPPELQDVPIEKIMETHVARFSERDPDWEAFEDAKIEGYKRAQHRFIGGGGSGGTSRGVNSTLSGGGAGFGALSELTFY